MALLRRYRGTSPHPVIKMVHADYSEFDSSSKSLTLGMLVDSYGALSESQTNWVCNLSNCASLLWHAYLSLGVPVNWAGFYVKDPEDANQLILGPFQGKVACQTITIGKGVCGTCAQTVEPQLVANVENFPGHIACDGETKSEIVIPIYSLVEGCRVVHGVIDIDCVSLSGFDEQDVEALQNLAHSIASTCKW